MVSVITMTARWPVLVTVLLLLLAGAEASHFRGGSIAWSRTSTSSQEVTISVELYLRRSAVDPAPAVGATLALSDLEDDALINFGDGSTSATMSFTVTTSDAGGDWMTLQGSIAHTYTAPGKYAPFVEGCCHMTSATIDSARYYLRNRYGEKFQITAAVDVTATSTALSSSIVQYPPVVQIISVPVIGSTATLALPSLGGSANPRAFRAASSTETGTSGSNPSRMSIDYNTGELTFSNGYGVMPGFYSIAIAVDETDTATSVVSTSMIEFLVMLRASASAAPSFSSPTPAQGTVFYQSSTATSPVSIPINAIHSDSGVTVHVAATTTGTSTSLTGSTGNPAVYTLSVPPNDGSKLACVTARTALGLSSVPRCFSVRQLDESQVTSWSECELAAFTEAEISGLPDAYIPLIAPSQIPCLSIPQVLALQPTHIAAMTTAQVAAFETRQLEALSAQQVELLTCAHVTELSARMSTFGLCSQLQAVSLTATACLTSSAASALAPTQMDCLTSQQIPVLSQSFFQAIPPSSISFIQACTKVVAVTPMQIGWLTNAQGSALLQGQVQCLSCSQILTLSSTIIAAWTPNQASGLKAAAIPCLNQTQTRALSASMMSDWSSSQLRALTCDQLKWLDVATINAMLYGALVWLRPHNSCFEPNPQIMRMTSDSRDALALEWIPFVVSAANTELEITEGGASATSPSATHTATYTIVMSVNPDADVVINTWSMSVFFGQITLEPSTLTFTPVTWAVPQTITMTAIDDTDVTGLRFARVDHIVDPSSATEFVSTVIAPVNGLIYDNDGEVLMLPTSLTRGEHNNDAEYRVRLASAPRYPVTMTINLPAGLRVVTPPQVVFHEFNYDQYEFVVISTIDNDVMDFDRVVEITHTTVSEDVAYDNITVGNVAVTIVDDDTAGISVSRDAIELVEGGSFVEYTVVLESRPTDTVTISLVTSNQVTIQSSATLVFTTAGNIWSTPQTVRVIAVDDAVAENLHTARITHIVSSTDQNYNHTESGVDVAITDNDTASISASTGAVSVTEGGSTATLTVQLTSEPVAEVSVVLTPVAPLQIATQPKALTFTSADWNTPQTVTVTAIDDYIDESVHATAVILTTATGDRMYMNANNRVNVSITDNDVAAVMMDRTAMDLTEGRGGTFNVWLNSQPTSTVSLTLIWTGAGVIDMTPTVFVFSPQQWNVSHANFVLAVDDFVFQVSTRQSIIGVFVSSADQKYDNLESRQVNLNNKVTVNVLEDDVASARFRCDPDCLSALRVMEGETTPVSWTVLSSQPTSVVNWTCSWTNPSAIADIKVSPNFFQQSPLEWRSPTQVSVTFEQDSVDTSDFSVSFQCQTVSADPFYNKQTQTLQITAINNDRAGISFASPGLSIRENGPGVTTPSGNFTFALDTKPQADVTVTFSVPGPLVVSPTTLTFSSSNWNVPQRSFVTLAHSPIDYGVRVFNVSALSQSSDNHYVNRVDNLIVTASDYDAASMILSTNTMRIVEGASAEVELRLTSQPTADVTVNIDMGRGATVSPSSVMTITAENWRSAFFTVTATDNRIDEGGTTVLATATATSADANYNAPILPVQNITVNVVDNDEADIVVGGDGTSVTLRESGFGAIYSLELTSEPTSPIEINVTPIGMYANQVAIEPAVLLFTDATWNIKQSVVLTAVDDHDVNGFRSARIAHKVVSRDSTYAAVNTPNVTAGIEDNDFADIIISLSEVDRVPARIDSIILAAAAGRAFETRTVTTTTTAGVAGRCKTQTNCMFDVLELIAAFRPEASAAALWQSTTETNPNLVEQTVFFALSGTHRAFVDVAFARRILLSLTERTIFIDESGSGQVYNVRLSARPTSDVVVTIDRDQAQVVTSPHSLVFGPGNWSVAQHVVVRAVDDDITEGAHMTELVHTAASEDAHFNVPPRTITCDITDNDEAKIDVGLTAPSNKVMEGASTTYQLTISSEPTAPVIIRASPSITGQVYDVPAVVFTAENWTATATVTITPIDDKVDEDDTQFLFTHIVQSADPFYNNKAVNAVTLVLEDNDEAGLTLTPATSCFEGGVSNFTVVLTSQPSDANVPVTVRVGSLSDVAVTSAERVFSTLNWDVPQSVVLSCVDDETPEGTETVSLEVSANTLDTKYAALEQYWAAVEVFDNDGAVVNSVSQVSVYERGASATFDLHLASRPSSPVVLTLSCPLDVTISPSTITVVSVGEDWSEASTVTVSAINNDYNDGTLFASLSISVFSNDIAYNNLNVSSVGVTLLDDDVAGVIVEPRTPVTAKEGDEVHAPFTIRLRSRPRSNVTIVTSGDRQVSAAPSRLVFNDNATTWAMPQPIHCVARDDLIAELPHSGVLTPSAVSADERYHGIDIASVDCHVADNDVPLVLLSSSTGDISEDGRNVTYWIWLNSEPTATVRVSVCVCVGQLTSTTTLVEFDPTTWSTPVPVTINAIDDRIAEGTHTAKVKHVVYSTDFMYNAIPTEEFTTTIEDNDVASVVITGTEPCAATGEQSCPIVVEEGNFAMVAVTITSEPLAEVQVDLTSTQIGISIFPSSVYFTSNEFEKVVNIKVMLADDRVARGPRSGWLRAEAASTDPNYNYPSRPASLQSLALVDNDSASIHASRRVLRVSEAGLVDTITITLGSEPLAPITVGISPQMRGAYLTRVVSGDSTITLDATNYEDGLNVEISATDDNYAQGDSVANLEIKPSSAVDTFYDDLNALNVPVFVDDDDIADLIAVPSDVVVVEGRPTPNICTKLTSRPFAAVTVAPLPPSAPCWLQTSPASAVFLESNWDECAQFTVTARYDDVYANETRNCSLQFAVDGDCADLAYRDTTADVNALLIDNDVPALCVSTGSSCGPNGTLTVEEGYNGIYTVRLMTAPRHPVTVNVAPLTDHPVRLVVDGSGPSDGVAASRNVAADASVRWNGPGVSTRLSPAVDTYTTSLDLRFDETNWNVPQPVEVHTLDNFVDEIDRRATVSHTSTSTDPLYQGKSAVMRVTLVDNDDAGVKYNTEATPVLIVPESGALVGSYGVVLTSEPSGSNTVSIAPVATAARILSISPANLTFDKDTWNVPQFFTVRAIDDVIQQGNRTLGINHDVSSTDAFYVNVTALRRISVTVVDNDVAQLFVSETRYTLHEDGTLNATAHVSLRTQPRNTVDLLIDSGDNITSSSINVTFSPSSWNVPIAVGLVAVNDFVDSSTRRLATTPVTQTLPPHRHWLGSLQVQSISSDSYYQGLKKQSVIQVLDDDFAGVTVVQETATAIEGGANGVLTVKLDSRPRSVVTVKLSRSRADRVELVPAELIFNPTEWQQVRTVEVFAVEDDIAQGNQTDRVLVTSSSEDLNYQTQEGDAPLDTVDVIVTDNDVAGITLALGSDAIFEGGIGAPMRVRLTSEPTSVVTVSVDLIGAAAAQLVTSQSTMTFNSTNWNIVQTIEVMAQDDDYPEGPQHYSMRVQGASIDPFYQDRLSDVSTIAVYDNDGAVIVSRDRVLRAEGDALDEIYSVRLASPATAPVRVTLDAAEMTPLVGSAGMLLPTTTILILPQAWNDTSNIIKASFPQNRVASGRRRTEIHHTTLSDDIAYTNLDVASVLVGVTDDDAAGIDISHNTSQVIQLAEGGDTITYTLSLTSRPLQDVIIKVSPDSQLATSVSEAKFTFLEWERPVEIAVSAVDDNVAEGIHSGTITHSVVTEDGAYTTKTIGDVLTRIVDNDTPEVVIVASNSITTTVMIDGIEVTTVTSGYGTGNSSRALTCREGGRTDTFFLSLHSEPTAPVTVFLPVSNQINLTHPQVVFQPAAWNNPVEITVTCDDDDVAEDPKTVIVTPRISSGDLFYDGLASTQFAQVIVEDNDEAGIVVSTTNVSVAESSTTTYGVRLKSRPTDVVVIDLSIADDTIASLAHFMMPSLTFTPTSWNRRQEVTVAYPGDYHARGQLRTTITHGAGTTSCDRSPCGDLFYSKERLTPALLPLLLTDRHRPGFSISTEAVTIAEVPTQTVGATATFELRLTSWPFAAVNVNLSVIPSDPVVVVSPDFVSLDASAWNSSTLITVRAINDFIGDGDRVTSISLVPSSSDGDYQTSIIPSVRVNVIDTVQAGIIPSQAQIALRENGPVVTVGLKLRSKSRSSVFLKLRVDDEPMIEISVPHQSNGIHFQPNVHGGWDVFQNFTIRCLDDSVAQGLRRKVLTVVAESNGDRNFDQVTITLPVTIYDDDTPGMAVSDTEFTLAEGDRSILQVVLMSRPVAPVTVMVASDRSNRLEITPRSYTLQPEEWERGVNISLAAPQNAIDQLDLLRTLSVFTNSTDPNYNLATGVTAYSLSSEVAVTVLDDDTADLVLAAPATPRVGDANLRIPVTEGMGGPQNGPVVKVSLNSEPTSDVTVRFVSNDDGGDSPVTAWPRTLTFRANDWNKAQDVYMGVIDDPDVNITVVTWYNTRFVIDSEDSFYDLESELVAVGAADNDVAEVLLVRNSTNNLTVSESGRTETFGIVLASRPLGAVTVTASFLTGEAVASTYVFEFGRENWASAQTCVLWAKADYVVEGEDPSFWDLMSISIESPSDENYAIATLPAPSIVVVEDDDGYEVRVSPNMVVLEEGGDAGHATVRLGAIPQKSVLITPQPTPGVIIVPDAVEITPGRWDQEQVFVFLAINDEMYTGDRSTMAYFNISSDDPNFSGRPPKDVVIEILEDDVASVVRNPPTVSTSEWGDTAVFTVRFTSQPIAGNCSVWLEYDTSQLQVLPSNVTLARSDWSAPMYFTIHAIDDSIAEGWTLEQIQPRVYCNDTTFNTLFIPPVDVIVFDNDGNGTVSETDPLPEGEGSDVIIHIGTRPEEPVVIWIDPSEGVKVCSNWVLVTPMNWENGSRFTITSIPDEQVAGDRVVNISFTTESGDPAYNNISLPNVNVTILDTDVNGLDISPRNDLVVFEGRPGVFVTLALTAQPTEPVTIDVDHPDNVEVRPSSITIGPNGWNSAHQIKVTAIDDFVARPVPSTPLSLRFTLNTDDSRFNGILDQILLQVIDDDTAGVNIKGTNLLVREGNNNNGSHLMFSLDSDPVAPVNLYLSSTRSQIHLSETTITLSDRNTNHKVVIQAVDDASFEGLHNDTITMTVFSEDTLYNTLEDVSVDVQVEDNDVAGIFISNNALELFEDGEPRSVGIHLKSQPSAPVFVRIISDDDDESAVRVTPSSIRFNPTNWDSIRDISITALDDDVARNVRSVSLRVQVDSSDDDYRTGASGVGAVVLTIQDNDYAGIVTTSVGGNIAYRQASSYCIALRTLPLKSVFITPTLSAGMAELLTVTAVSPPQISPEEAPRAERCFTVALKAAVRGLVAPALISHSLASEDLPYNGNANAETATSTNLGASVSIPIDSAALPSIWLSKASMVVQEGAVPSTYNVGLGSEPTEDVIVELSLTNLPDGVIVAPTVLTFTVANWEEPQLVSISKADDGVARGRMDFTVRHTATSADTGYSNIASTLSVELADRELATVLASDSTLNIIEGGNVSVAASLTVAPLSTVTVTPIVSLATDVDQTVNLGGLRFEPSTLTFTASNWNTQQVIRVFSIEDDYDTEDEPLYTVELTASGDTAFASAYALVNVIVADNDYAGVQISVPVPFGLRRSGSSAAIAARMTEGGDSLPITLRCTSRPLGHDVTLSLIIPELQHVVSVTPPSHVCNNADTWNNPWNAVVSVTDDNTYTGDESLELTLSLESGDDHFRTSFFATHSSKRRVSVAIIEDDVVGIELPTATLEMLEGGDSINVPISLMSEPTADVQLSLSSPSPALIYSPIELTFAPTNWNVPQSVLLTATRDYVVKGQEEQNIDLRASSPDKSFNRQRGSIGIAVNDTDTAGIEYTVISELVEGGVSKALLFKLVASPESPVQVFIRSATEQIEAAPGSMRFSASNWNEQQRVMLTAVDDPFVEGTMTETLQFIARSSDSRWTFDRSTDITVVDNDEHAVGRDSNHTLEEDTTIEFALAVIESELDRPRYIEFSKMPDHGVVKFSSKKQSSNNGRHLGHYNSNRNPKASQKQAGDILNVGDTIDSSDFANLEYTPLADNHGAPLDIIQYHCGYTARFENNDVAQLNPENTSIAFYVTAVNDAPRVNLTVATTPPEIGIDEGTGADGNDVTDVGTIIYLAEDATDPDSELVRVVTKTPNGNSAKMYKVPDDAEDTVSARRSRLRGDGSLIRRSIVGNTLRTDAGTEGLVEIQAGDVVDDPAGRVVFVAAENAAGLPLAEISFFLSDGVLNSSEVALPINVHCPSGFEFKDSSKSCRQCSPGSATTEIDVPQCTLCPPGMHAPNFGSRKCLICPDTTYQGILGGVDCSPCPAHSRSQFAATARTQCMCTPGMYGSVGSDPSSDPHGIACRECPDHTICEDPGQPVPVPEPGYWLDSSTAVAGEDVVVVRCTPREACPDYSQMMYQDVGSCAEGFVGRACSKCDNGYFRFGLECRECADDESSSDFFVFMAVFAFLIMLPVVWVLARSLRFTAVFVTLEYVQTLAYFRWYYMPAKLNTFWSHFSIFLLDLQSFEPECSLAGWNELTHWSVRMFLPVLITLGLFCTVPYNRLKRTEAFQKNKLLKRARDYLCRPTPTECLRCSHAHDGTHQCGGEANAVDRPAGGMMLAAKVNVQMQLHRPLVTVTFSSHCTCQAIEPLTELDDEPIRGKIPLIRIICRQGLWTSKDQGGSLATEVWRGIKLLLSRWRLEIAQAWLVRDQHSTMEHNWRSVYRTLALFVMFGYMYLCSTPLEWLDCTKNLGDGKSYLDREPSLECYGVDTEWFSGVWFAIIGAVCYSVGVVLLVTLLLYRSQPHIDSLERKPEGIRLRRQGTMALKAQRAEGASRLAHLPWYRRLITSPCSSQPNACDGCLRTAETYAVLFHAIEPRRVSKPWMWVFFTLVRKALFVISAMFNTTKPVEQASWGFVFILCALLVQVYFRPYRQDLHNTMAFVTQTSSLATLFSGILFLGGANADGDNTSWRVVLFNQFIIPLTLIFCCCAILLDLARDVSDNLKVYPKRATWKEAALGKHHLDDAVDEDITTSGVSAVANLAAAAMNKKGVAISDAESNGHGGHNEDDVEQFQQPPAAANMESEANAVTTLAPVPATLPRQTTPPEQAKRITPAWASPSANVVPSDIPQGNGGGPAAPSYGTLPAVKAAAAAAGVDANDAQRLGGFVQSRNTLQPLSGGPEATSDGTPKHSESSLPGIITEATIPGASVTIVSNDVDGNLSPVGSPSATNGRRKVKRAVMKLRPLPAAIGKPIRSGAVGSPSNTALPPTTSNPAAAPAVAFSPDPVNPVP